MTTQKTTHIPTAQRSQAAQLNEMVLALREIQARDEIPHVTDIRTREMYAENRRYGTTAQIVHQVLYPELHECDPRVEHQMLPIDANETSDNILDRFYALTHFHVWGRREEVILRQAWQEAVCMAEAFGESDNIASANLESAKKLTELVIEYYESEWENYQLE